VRFFLFQKSAGALSLGRFLFSSARCGQSFALKKDFRIGAVDAPGVFFRVTLDSKFETTRALAREIVRNQPPANAITLRDDLCLDVLVTKKQKISSYLSSFFRIRL